MFVWSLSGDCRFVLFFAGHDHGDELAHATYVRDNIRTAMGAVRTASDLTETLVADEYWTLPKVAEMVWLGV